MRVEVHHLKKKYGKVPLFNLEHVDFEEGKISGVTGANGVGKTTLLRIMAGLDSGFEGSLVYGGSHRVTAQNILLTPIRQQVSYLPQSPYMLARTVWENITYPLTLREKNLSQCQPEAMKMLRELELEPLKNKKATHISSGEAQRVALARGLVFSPKLLLLDEVTANIDTHLTVAIESLIRNRVREDGVTAVVVSHDLEQLKRWCDKIFILEAGKCTELVL